MDVVEVVWELKDHLHMNLGQDLEAAQQQDRFHAAQDSISSAGSIAMDHKVVEEPHQQLVDIQIIHQEISILLLIQA